MGSIKSHFRAEGHDAGRVDPRMAVIVVLLDMVKVHRVGYSWLLVEIPQIAVEVVVVLDPAQVALEVPIIDGIEAYQGRKEPPVGLGNLITDQVALRAQPGLQFVQDPRS